MVSTCKSLHFMNIYFFFTADDGSQPSGNSIACSNLLRLAIYLDRDDLRHKAEKLLCAFGNKLANCPAACPQMMLALIEFHHPMQVRASVYLLLSHYLFREIVSALNIFLKQVFFSRFM